MGNTLYITKDGEKDKQGHTKDILTTI